VNTAAKLLVLADNHVAITGASKIGSVHQTDGEDKLQGAKKGQAQGKLIPAPTTSPITRTACSHRPADVSSGSLHGFSLRPQHQ